MTSTSKAPESGSNREPVVADGALHCPNCYYGRGDHTPFVKAERESGCFRCGYKWPEYCQEKADMPSLAQSDLEAGMIALLETCTLCDEAAPIEGGLCQCSRCAAWLYSGIPVKL